MLLLRTLRVLPDLDPILVQMAVTGLRIVGMAPRSSARGECRQLRPGRQQGDKFALLACTILVYTL